MAGFCMFCSPHAMFTTLVTSNPLWSGETLKRTHTAPSLSGPQKVKNNIQPCDITHPHPFIPHTQTLTVAWRSDSTLCHPHCEAIWSLPPFSQIDATCPPGLLNTNTLMITRPHYNLEAKYNSLLHDTRCAIYSLLIRVLVCIDQVHCKPLYKGLTLNTVPIHIECIPCFLKCTFC